MKPVLQTITTPPTGNCLAACVASLFDLPLWLVPNFAALDRWRVTDQGWRRVNPDEEPLWWDRLCSFGAEQGWRVLATCQRSLSSGHFGRFLYGDHAIATVKSPRGPHFHCVIAEVLTGEVVWDPHPEGYPEGHIIPDTEILDWIFFVALN